MKLPLTMYGALDQRVIDADNRLFCTASGLAERDLIISSINGSTKPDTVVTTEFRVAWCQCPTIQHNSRVLFIQARDIEHAKALATDHVERAFGIGWFVFRSIEPYIRPMGGRVVSG